MPAKTLKCCGCKLRFDAETMSKLPAGNFHSIDCAIEYSRAKQDKARAKQASKDKQIDKVKQKAVRAQNRKDKERLKTKGQYIKEAQASVNKYIRLRDRGKACISCGNLPAQKFGGTMDAGHYRSRGAASHLRFNTFNIHAQCVKCNRFGSGNAVDYRINLIKLIGIERVERIENDNKPRTFSIEYLTRVKRIFNKRARHIDKINSL